MNVRFSYDQRFERLINDIKSRYGEEILSFSGVHPRQLDMAGFTRDFLFGGDKSNAIADMSVDANANVDDRSVVSFDHEVAKALNKLNALNMIWTYIHDVYDDKKVLSHSGYGSVSHAANTAIEDIISCGLYLNDAHYTHKAYSYYEHTPITTRINGKVRQMTLKQLYDTYANYASVVDDAEVINLKGFELSIDLEMTQLQLNKNARRTVRYRRSSFAQTHHPRERHTVEVWDGSEFVAVDRVLRHKRHNRLVEITVESGNMLLVTEDHPIILENGTEVPAGEVGVGHTLATAERYKDWQQRYSISNDLAYTLGFLAGDGNIPRHRFYDAACSVSNEDVAIVYDTLRNQFYAYQKNIDTAKIYRTVQSLGIENKVTVHKNGKVMSFCSLQLSHCCAKVFGLNEGHASYSKYAPRNIMEWNRDAQLSYLAGIIDAEGTMMHDGRTCSVRMTSLSIINQLHELCAHLQIYSRVGISEEGLYRIYMRIVPELRILSEKCSPYEDMVLNAAYGNRSETSIVKRIRFIEDGRVDLSGRDNYEYVYDITTSSGTFYACGFKAHNCYSFDLTPLVMDGMPFVKKIHIGPPRHFSSMIDLVVQSTAFISNQIAGAASFPNLLIYLDYFARKDFGEKYWLDPSALSQVHQGLQCLVYSLNFSFRGSQSAFSNLSIYDDIFLKDLFGTLVYPDGSSTDIESVKMMQKIFMNWYNGELEKQTFTFPVLTANLATENNEIIDKEFLKFVSEVNLPFGILNIYTGPATCLSSCCRLRSELIREHTNSLGTGSVSIGSHRVCTISLPRIAIEADGDRKRFMEILKKRIQTTHLVLNAHRKILIDLIDHNRLPLYTYGWMHLKKQYSTVGLLGPYEACKFMGMDITDEEGSDFIVDVMDLINVMNIEEEKYWADGRRFNLELIPGEQAAIKLCEADKMLYPTFKNPYILYSNQFVPLIDKSDVYTRMMLQGKFDSRAQGGCIMHLNMDHRLNNADQMQRLIESAAKLGALYFAVNLNIAWCLTNHASVGKNINTCHTCGGPIVRNMTRVVGFITDVSDWSKVRRWEYDRRYFYHQKEVMPDSPEHTLTQEASV